MDKDCANQVVLRAGWMYNSRVQAASAVGSTSEGDTRSDPRRPLWLQYYKTYYMEEEIKPKGDIWQNTFRKVPRICWVGETNKLVKTWKLSPIGLRC